MQVPLAVTILRHAHVLCHLSCPYLSDEPTCNSCPEGVQLGYIPDKRGIGKLIVSIDDSTLIWNSYLC